MSPNSKVMQLTIHFYPAVNHNYDDNPMGPKTTTTNKEKNQLNKENGNNHLDPFKKTFLSRKTFAKIIDGSVNRKTPFEFLRNGTVPRYKHGGCVKNHFLQ